MSAAAGPPALEPGSARYFMWLYSPPVHRGRLATLLALADEIDAGIHRQLDHALAHVRLQWWRQEAQRCERGTPEHPWLIAWQREGGAPPALIPLIDAAAIDLANQQLAGAVEHRLACELFVLAARILLPAPWAPEQAARLRELGGSIAELEQLPRHGGVRRPLAPAAPTATAAAALPVLQRPGPLIEPALQPPLAPLLVWLALAARQAQRRCRRVQRKLPVTGGSRLDGFTDNIVAWRTARHAARGQFRLEGFRIDECHG